MWLLRLHFAISVLCLITFMGFGKVCKEQIKANGWVNGENKKKSDIVKYLGFFVPFMNVLLVLIIFFMIGTNKSDYEKTIKETQENNEESN